MLLAVVLCACAAAGIGVSSVFPSAQAADWTGCACGASEDPQLVGNLLEQLSTSTEKFIGCRQQLLRRQYHVPIIIGNPLGENSLLWQCLSGALAVACAVLAVQLQRSKAQASKLQQHSQQREAAWQQAITTVHAKAQERLQQWEQSWRQQEAVWREKEAEWEQGVQEVVQLVQQREAALCEPGGASPNNSSTAKVCDNWLGSWLQSSITKCNNCQEVWPVGWRA